MKLFRRKKPRKAISALEGQTLGKYQVLEPLGRGGMARVYRAYHPQLDRYVAIKVLRSNLVQDDTFFDRFRREARAVAAFRHPNVVRVFDYDVQGDISYMVLELLEGDSLKTRLHDYRVRGESMPLGDVVRILLDVLDGLAYAHSEGMIHRDIKPGNVLLTKRGRAVIADFGIAQMVGGTRHTVPGALLGTMDYVAPEQGLESQSDARSDIYSLGVVLYEMLARRTPFEADTPVAVLMKHAHDPLPLPRQIDPSIPEPFERVVLKALAKDPDRRYQSAEAMAQALREAAEQAEIELPQRISLPLSFTTDEAPSESVAVFSGPERERITDAGFASDDTAATLGKHPRQPSRTLERLRAGEPLLKPGSAILLAMGLVSLGNLAAFTVAGVTGLWAVFGRGWPLEFFLVAAGLSMVMHATGSPRLLIPLGILLGNGFIFTYCTFTGNWRHWLFLWVFEIWTIAGAVVSAIWLARQDRSARASRLVALVVGPIALGLSVIVSYASIALGILDIVLDWIR
jgi:serine/threonine-protein kinase